MKQQLQRHTNRLLSSRSSQSISSKLEQPSGQRPRSGSNADAMAGRPRSGSGSSGGGSSIHPVVWARLEPLNRQYERIGTSRRIVAPATGRPAPVLTTACIWVVFRNRHQQGLVRDRTQCRRRLRHCPAAAEWPALQHLPRTPRCSRFAAQTPLSIDPSIDATHLALSDSVRTCVFACGLCKTLVGTRSKRVRDCVGRLLGGPERQRHVPERPAAVEKHPDRPPAGRRDFALQPLCQPGEAHHSALPGYALSTHDRN